MCTVLLPPGVNTIAVNKHIISFIGYVNDLYTMRRPEQTAMFLTTVVAVGANAVGLSDLNGICSLSHVFTSNITALIYR